MRFVTILSAIATVNAFPTVENLAWLAQQDSSLSGITEETIDELTGHLTTLKEKRLLFDPLVRPIDG